MKIRMLGVLLVPVLGLGMAACDVDKTEDGKLPDVQVEGGNLPEYDVDAADVDIKKDTQTVVVPKVEVTDPDNDTTARR